MAIRATRWAFGLAAAILATGFLAPGRARAGLVIDQIIVQQIPDPVFQVSIGQIQLTGTSQIFENDYFTVYDFPNNLIQGTNIQPSPLWAANVPFPGLGQTPPGAEIEDDPNLLNATWRYIGTDPITVPAGQSFFNLGIFKVTEIADSDAFPNFLQFAYSIHDGMGNVEVGTGSSPVTVRLVPEPASLTLVGFGAPLAAWGLWRRRRILIG